MRIFTKKILSCIIFLIFSGLFSKSVNGQCTPGVGSFFGGFPLISSSPVTCVDSTGSVSFVSWTGGSSFDWCFEWHVGSPGGLSIGNGTVTIGGVVTNGTVNNLPAGDYFLVIYNSAGKKYGANIQATVFGPNATMRANLASPVPSVCESFCTGNATAYVEDSTGLPDFVFTWTDALGDTIWAESSSDSSTTPNTLCAGATYNVNIVDQWACDTTFSFVVPVDSMPVPDPGSDDTICEGQSVLIGGASTAGSTYSWTPVDGSLNDPTSSNPTATPATTTTYTVEETDSKGCVGSSSVTITVNNKPIVFAGNDTSVCRNGDVTLTATGSNGTDPYTYSWGLVSDGLSSDTGQSVTANTNVTVTYGVTTESQGCISDPDSITLTVLAEDSLLMNLDTVCLSDASPIANFTVSGASGGSIYNWYETSGGVPTTAPLDGASESFNVGALAAGTYPISVEVTTLSGCKDTISTTLLVNEAFDATISRSVNPICLGESTILTVTTIPAGGTTVWTADPTLTPAVGSPVTATPDVTPTKTYTATITNNGCSITRSTTIDVNVLPTVVVPDDTTLCDTGLINLTGTGSSSGAFTYLWTANPPGNATIASATSLNTTATLLATGTTEMILTVTNTSTSCEKSDTFNVIASPLPSAEAAVNPSLFCNGSSTPVTLDGTGSATGGGVTYLWTSSPVLVINNSTLINADATVAATTTFILTVDSAGCIDTAMAIVTTYSPPTIDADPSSFCFGILPATTDVTISDVGAGSIFTWTPPGCALATTAPLDSENESFDFSGCPVGNYTISVLVQDVVSGCDTTVEVDIDVVASVGVPTFTPDDPSLCLGDNVQITASATAATAYSWSPTTNLSGSTIANPIITPTVAGSIIYTVTATAGTCSNSATVTVTANPVLVADAGTTKTICSGNGVVLGNGTSATGGNGVYTYLWEPAATLTGSTTATPTASPTATTTYTLTVTDGSTETCSDTDMVVVRVNAKPSADAGGPFDICEGTCDTIGASPTASGGTAPYTYSWITASELSGPTTANPEACPTGAGGTSTNYTVFLTDQNGCMDTAVAIVNIKEPPVASAGNDTTICSSGSGVVIGSAALPGATYSWTPTATLNNPALAQPTATPLATTTYTVTVTDAFGCTNTDQVIVNIIAAPTANSGNDTSICAGGTIARGGSPTATGGTPTYVYAWSSVPVGFSSTASNPSGITPAVTTVYTVIVTDQNGCTGTDNSTVTVNALPNVNAGPDTTTCSGSGIVIGGTPTSITAGVTYSWSPITDLNNAILANPTTTTTISRVYTVVVTQTSTGCFASDNVLVDANSRPVIDAGTSTTICYGSTLNIGSATATGGTAPYTYSWSPGTNLTDSTISNPVANPVVTTTYVIYATDSNGCTGTDTIIITVNPQIITDSGSDTTICYNSSLTLGGSPTAIGGTGALTYDWSPVTFIANPDSANPVASNITSSIQYILTVTDAASCSQEDTINITVSAPISLTLDTNSSTCTLSDGQVWVVVDSGGIPPFTFLWDDPLATTNDTLLNVPARVYCVTVTDSIGCTQNECISVNDEGAPIVDITDSTAVSCFGVCDGSATAVASGGTGTLTYSWTGGSTTTLSGNVLCAGVNFITVTDSNGCISAENVNINTPAALVVDSFTVVPISCNGDSDGQLTAHVSGGILPYSYFWTPPGGVPVLNDSIDSLLTAQTYTVTVSDSNGCSVSRARFCPQPEPLVISSSVTNVTCNGDSSGAITLTVTMGTSPYTYSWAHDGSALPTASNLPAGTYTVYVNDQNGCTINDTITIIENSTIALNGGQTAAGCGFTNGKAGVAPTGGGGGYSYIWTNSVLTVVSITDSLLNVGAGIYCVTVTDANGCTADTCISILNITTTVVTTTISQVSCAGGTNGTATANATSGTPPYDYLWNPGTINAPAASNLPSGSYTLTVTDNQSCVSYDTIFIPQPSALVLSIDSTDATCSGTNDGEATATVTGGTPIYTYSWSSGSTGSIASSLAAGAYTLTVTDAEGCTISGTATISSSSALTLAVSKTDVLCNGDSTGTATVVAGGGTGPYVYSWNTSPGQNTTTAVNLWSGTYSIFVNDSQGCSGSTSIFVDEPPVLTATASSTAPSGCGINDGTATVNAAGGVTPYSYLWSQTGTTVTISGLAAGAYGVDVTDSNGCVVSTSVGVNDGLGPVITTSKVDVTCNGGSDGSASVSIVSGTAPFVFTWDDGTLGASRTGLSQGVYTVAVSDSSGCVTTQTITISEPQAITIALTVNNIDCNGNGDGSIAAIASGGSGVFNYSWDDPATQTTATASNLVAGTYCVTVTDQVGCTAQICQDISEPSVLNVTATSIDATCFGSANGSATATVTGGTSAYTYSWNSVPTQTSSTATSLSSGNYIITITDGNGCMDTTSVNVSEPDSISLVINPFDTPSCNTADGSIAVIASGGAGGYAYSWNVGSTNDTIFNVPAGFYTVEVTDANGCSASEIGELSNSTGPVVTVTFTEPVCPGDSNGSATVTIVSGNGPFDYIWGNTNPIQVSNVASGLPAGYYPVTITDINSCITVGSVDLTDPTEIVATIFPTNVTCFGDNDGSAFVTASNGELPYTYAWSTGSTATNVSNLTAGTYTISITDQTGCSITSSFVISQPDSLLLSISKTDVECSGGSDGSATVTVSGGTGLYTYTWSSGSSGPIASGISAGTHTVTVTDANGCSKSSSIVIEAPSAMSITISTTAVLCDDDSNGTATATVTGGTGIYTYSWLTSPTQISNTINGLKEGSYTLYVSDANGCSANSSGYVDEPDSLYIISVVTTPPSNCNASNGTATVTPGGGTGSYTYSWYDGSTNQTNTGLDAGVYLVDVIDTNGCRITTSAAVDDISGPSVIKLDSSNVSCNGGSNGTATVFATGVEPFTYSWTSGSPGNTAAVTGLGAGIHSVSVEDAAGCITAVSFNITEPESISFDPTVVNVVCNGQSTGSITSNASGGTLTYGYSWSSGQTTADASGLAAGTYTLTLTDGNGCTAQLVQDISETNPVVATITASSDAICYGTSDGLATVTAVGGAGSYTYSWNSFPVQTTPTAVGLPAGNYIVTVTDLSGCTDSASVVIGNPDSMVFSMTQTSSTCNGSNGSATVTVLAGEGPFAYLWNSGGVTDPTISGIPAGFYFVTVTDINGCSDTTAVNLNDLGGPVVTFTSTDPLCPGDSNGTACALAVGGGPFTYIWSTVFPPEDSSCAIGLPAGNYPVTVADTNNCITVGNLTLTDPAELVLTMSGNNVSCNGGSDGTASATASFGVPPYTYSWSTGGTGSGISTLPAGTYTVFANDSSGCTVEGSVIITQPGAITSTSTSQDVTCFGVSDGSASVTIAGGTPLYGYNWLPSGGTGSTASGLASGSYSVTVTDNNGCTFIDTIFVDTPPALVTNVSTTPTLCNGDSTGTATANSSGGTGAYTFTWLTTPTQTTSSIINLPAGTYTVVTRDANNCFVTADGIVTEPLALVLDSIDTIPPSSCVASDGAATIYISGGTGAYSYSWSTGGTDSTESGLPAGVYPVLVTDANGCTLNVSVGISNTGGPNITVVETRNVSCNGDSSGLGRVTATGKAVLTYLWSLTGTNDTVDSGLWAATHPIQVTDGDGCITVGSIVISEPDPISIALTPTNVTCASLANGTISSTVTGGTGSTYGYLWSNAQTTSTATSLAPNTYTLTVTDSLGCTQQASQSVTEPGALSDSVTSLVNAICNGTSTGSATVAGSGGIPGYTYTWSHGASTAAISSLSAGFYTYTITDFTGCSIVDTIEIDEPAALTLSTTQTDPTCNAANGSACVVVTGGTPPYVYDWSNTVTISCISSVSAGIYTIEVTDSNGCIADTSVNLSNVGGPAVTFNITNPTCPGDSNGAICAIVTGEDPFVFEWNTVPIDLDSCVSGLPAGTYSLETTDNNGCLTVADTILVDPLDIVLTLTGTPVSCFGGADGVAAVTASSGAPPYDYLWTPSGSIVASSSGLSAGFDTIVVTGSNGCTKSGVVEITQPDSLNLTLSSTGVTCNGGNDGTATVVVTGGTGAYTYSWSPTGGSGAIASGLASDTYTVFVTDVEGCVKSGTVIVGSTSALTAVVNTTPVSCNGDSNGTATAVPSGGTPGYTYSWLTALTESTVNITGRPADTYTVVVSDSNGCSVTVSGIIVEPDALTLDSTTTLAPSSCVASDGSATVYISGGTPPYTYLWDDPLAQTTQTADSLAAGVYNVIITDSNGCTTTVPVGVSNTGGPIVSLSITDVICFGDSTGTATATATGKLPLSPVWSNGKGTNFTATGLLAQAYTVAVSDSDGCVTTRDIVIGEPPVINITLTPTNVTCNGAGNGSITSLVTGGTGASYTYSWSPAGGTASSASSLLVDTYTVTVTDMAGCTKQAMQTISEPAVLTATVTSTNDATCFGLEDGSATVNPSGGTLPYTYTWNTLPSPQFTPTATALGAGTYTYTIVDSRGCTLTDTVSIGQPSAITFIVDTIIDATCNTADGSACLTATGGSPGYAYLWNTLPADLDNCISNVSAGFYNLEVTDLMGCIRDTTINISNSDGPEFVLTVLNNANCSGVCDRMVMVDSITGNAPFDILWSAAGQTDATAVGLCSGQTYSVSVTDSLGCIRTKTFTLDSIPQLDIDITQTNVTCFGGSNGTAAVVHNGGNDPFIYSWSNSTSAQTTSGLLAQTYSVFVIDSDLCNVTKTFVITQQDSMDISISTTNIVCSSDVNGTATATVTGGAGGYGYSWFPTLQTGSTATGLTADTYTVTVTDANTCQDTALAVIVPGITVDVDVTIADLLCNGDASGKINTSTTGGTGPYNYVWSVPESADSIINLDAGIYTLTVTSAEGCFATEDSLVVDEPDAITANTTTTEATCGLADGSANVTVAGGTTPYSYTAGWVATSVTTAILDNVVAGTYNLTIQDSNNCTLDVNNIAIDNPNGPTLDFDSIGVSCFGDTNGTAIVIATGNVPFKYLWNDPQSQTNDTAFNLSPGIYAVAVTDDSLCVTNGTVTIIEPDTMTITFAVVSPSCGFNNGSITATVTGGTAPYTYSWSAPGSSSNVITSISPGTYILTVTDQNGCIKVASVNVSGTTALLATYAVQNNTCFNSCDGSIIPTVLGGTPPYSYAWIETGTPTDTISKLDIVKDLCAGSYDLIITDPTGCGLRDTIEITEPADITLTNTIVDAKCLQNDGFIKTIVNGGTPPFDFSLPWIETSDSSADALNLFAGNYTLTVTDTNGCTKTFTIGVDNENAPVVKVDSINPSCFGNCDAGATLIVTGNDPFTYSWSSLETDSIIKDKCAATYFYQVTDALGCIETGSVNLNEPSPILPNAVLVYPSCGGSDGSISLFPSGGSGTTYSYEWINPNPNITPIAPNLPNGDYEVIIRDSALCPDTIQIPLYGSDALSANVVTTNTSCNGDSNGTAAVVILTGTAPFTYDWSVPPPDTTPAITGLKKGNYVCIVTDSNNCSISVNGDVDEPAAISIVIDTTFADCGVCNGTATANVSGGTPPYLYSWSVSGLSDTTPMADSLCAGIPYKISVLDSNNCQSASIAIILNPGAPVFDLDSINATCNGKNDGMAWVDSIIGDAPFVFDWWGDYPVNPKNNDTISELLAGTYYVSVTDVNLCVSVDSIEVNEPTPITATFNVTNASCDSCNGMAIVTAAGGSGSYTYQWESGSTTTVSDSLCAGFEALNISTSPTCMASFDVPVDNIGGPDSLTFTSTNVSCFGDCNGTATVNIFGGAAPYSILWISPFATTAVIGPLCANDYNVEVRDSNNCIKTGTVTITEPDEIFLNPFAVSPECQASDGSIYIDPTGGIANYSYSWSGGNVVSINSNFVENLESAVYSVEITSLINGCKQENDIILNNTIGPVISAASKPNNCSGLACSGTAVVTVSSGNDPYTYSWSPGGDTTTGITAQCPGTYFVYVEDSIGCQSIDSTTIGQPAGPVLGLPIIQHVTCSGLSNGSITCNPSGGTLPYTYAWVPGPNITTVYSNLQAGTYTATVTDKNNCAAFQTDLIVTEPMPLTLTLDSTSTKCNNTFDGKIVPTVSGGTPVYTYLWSGSLNSTNDTLLNAGVGGYTLTVTDQNGCTKSASDSIKAITTVIAKASADDTICSGVPISMSNSGGVTYAWFTFAPFTQVSTGTPFIVNPVESTTYLAIAYKNTCSDTDSVVVTIGESPTANAGTDEEILINGAGIMLNGTGAGDNGTYLWEPATGLDLIGIANPQANPLINTIYTLTVTNSKGCSDKDSVLITVVPKIQVSDGLTPNGDGLNDGWAIDFIDEYPNCDVEIYNRWGQKLWWSIGYKSQWKGTDMNGDDLPIGTYYYIINLNNAQPPFIGPITIMR